MKKPLKRLSVFLLLQVSITFLWAQGQAPQLPKIIPPSPEAAAFQRYGEIPLDYSTGVPKIEIPLYTVKSKKLEVPISISYHASGIKVNDLSTMVGLGWVINTGGIVTRTILDLCDENSAKVMYKTPEQKAAAVNAQYPTYTQMLTTVGSVTEPDYANRNKRSDRYFYQLSSGKSGAFTYDFLTDSLVKIIYSPVKIKKRMLAGGIPEIAGFDITDESGTLYSFKVREQCYPGSTTQFPNAWYLSSITSADKTDTIRFTYKTFINQYSHPAHSHSLNWYDDPQNALCYGSPTYQVTSQAASLSWSGSFDQSGCTPLLDSIVSSNSAVVFSYSFGRLDGPPYKLDGISIVDRLSGTIKDNITFQQSYFGTPEANNLRLRLDAVILNNNSPQSAQKYSLAYNSMALPPYPDKTTPALRFNEDYWGYYNNSNSASLIPHHFIRQSEVELYKGNRDPDPSTDALYAKACMLEEITYPTGGKTVFEFERHQISGAYEYYINTLTYGGFRVKRIKSYTDASTLAFQKTYDYMLPVADVIRQELFTMLVNNNYLDPAGNAGCFVSYPTKVVMSSPLQPFKTVMYSKVTEFSGTEAMNTGKTVINYVIPGLDPLAEGQPEEYNSPQFMGPYQYDKGDPSPRLVSKITYKNEGGTYKPVRKDSTVYQSFRSNVFSTGVHINKTANYMNLSSPAYGYDIDPMNYYNTFYVNTFVYTAAKGYEEVFLPTQNTVQEFDDNANVTLSTTSTTTYGNLDHLQPTEQMTINSKGENLRTVLKYPVDFNTQAPYTIMLARNIQAPVIEQQQYNGTQFLQSVKTNYKAWTSTIIEPETVDTKLESNTPETRIRFLDYDTQGNVISVSKENDVKYCYLYDYSQTHPVAQVTNTTIDQVAYTSFEAEGKGNWTFTGTPTAPADGFAPTGKKYYQLSAGALNKASLTSATTYVVSYWYKDGTVQITGGTQSTLQTMPGQNGWTLATLTVTGTTSITVSGSGTTKIDEVRLYPLGSQMTTYTYDPLIGITTATDANNITMYYQYDAANRLQAIRDSKGNILKTLTYHYKQ